MDFPLQYQFEKPEKVSRMQALFGFFFIIPQFFVILFRSILASIYGMIAWWLILLTGKMPESWFEYIRDTTFMSIQMQAYLMVLTSDKPQTDSAQLQNHQLKMSMPYPDSFSRLNLFFGFFFIIPHIFRLIFFRALIANIHMTINWIMVLLTGKVFDSSFEYLSAYLRLMTRINVFMQWLTPQSPPNSMDQ